MRACVVQGVEPERVALEGTQCVGLAAPVEQCPPASLCPLLD